MEKFEIKNRKGLKIVGELSIPKKSKGLSFTLHGLGGFKEQPHIIILANTLLENDYTVINFDATNSTGESGGKYGNATFQDHYENLVDVITWAKTQIWYKQPFILAGQSLGGYAVARYAEDYPKEVKALLFYAGVVAGELSYKSKEKFESAKFKTWKETGWREEESKSRPGLIKRLPWSYMEEGLKHDLRPNASKLTMPILFVVGGSDKAHISGDQKVLYDIVSGPKEMHIVPGAPHDFCDLEHLRQLKTVFNNWLKNLK
ncbi:MAG: alpha/beta fold hydrolase [Candidatus Paceibacterota bacterium]|jgi:pimeloyl-ACP methyl ester carboxylesterase